MRLAFLCLVAFAALPPSGHAQVPVFEIQPAKASVKFDVQASVAIEGTFDKWDATLKFTSADATSGVLDIKSHSDSVNTRSGMKDNKLKGKDFFDAKNNPYITFKSTKIVPSGPDAADVQGVFTIRGVSKPETLKLKVERNA